MKQRWNRALLAMTVALAAAGIVTVVTQSRPSRLAADFTIDYSAGTLVREGRLAAPYDQAVLAVTMRQVAPGGGIDPRLPYNRPLLGSLPFALLSFLPIDVAFRLWQAVAVGLLLASLVLLSRRYPLGDNARWLGALALLAAVPTWAILSEGQISPLVLLGAVLVLLSARSGTLAMAALGGVLLALKPQYLPAYLTVLLAARQWRALMAAGAASVAVLLSPLVAGNAALQGFVHNAVLANQAVSPHLDESWIGAFSSFLPSQPSTLLAIGLEGVCLVALIEMAWRRRETLTAFAISVGVLVVLASPHALPHDTILLAVPAWLSVSLYREGRLPKPLWGWVLVDLALVADLHGLPVPIAPIVVTLLAAWMLRHLRRRTELQAVAA